MPKTLNSGSLIRRTFSLHPYQVRGLAERSKSDSLSIGTLVRDALNLYLGFSTKSPDRVNRPFTGEIPKPRKSDPRPDVTPQFGYTLTEPPAPAQRPTARLVAKRGRPPAQDKYTIMADPESGLMKNLVMPYDKVLAFWKRTRLPPGQVSPGGQDFELFIRNHAAPAGLSPLEAYELYACFEWDDALVTRLKEDSRASRPSATKKKR